MQYAGFWRRFAAVIIDGIALSIFFSVVSVIVGVRLSVIYSGEGASVAPGRAAALSLISIAAYWLYYALLESSPNQATLGKMALGIVVTDLQGARISFGRATGRHFAKYLSSLILMIGYLMAGFTRQKQALHDILAGTLVVVKR